MRSSKNQSSVMGNSKSSRVRRSFQIQQYQRPGISLDQIQQIKQAFDLFDNQGAGVVHPKQLRTALNSLGGEAKSQPIFQMINDLCQQGTEDLQFAQFLDLMTARISNKDSRQDMKKVFMLFDQQKSGYISLASLKKVVKQLGENIDESQLQQMIQKADFDKDGVINQQQFYNVMTRKIGK